LKIVLIVYLVSSFLLAGCTSVHYAKRIQAGDEFQVNFNRTADKFDDAIYTGDSNTDPMGTIKGGEVYAVRYDSSTGKWTATGFNQWRRSIATYTYPNGSPEAGEFNIWGRVFKFSEKGEVFDPAYGFVGHLSFRE
jgi:hypothetical protein